MKIEFEPRVAELKQHGEGIEIAGVVFAAEHGQDCCENVYADWEQAANYKEPIEKLGQITKLEVENVEGAGFTIFAYNGENRVGIFIPCYNEQNGYYSDHLELIANDYGNIQKMDVEKKDSIY